MSWGFIKTVFAPDVLTCVSCFIDTFQSRRFPLGWGARSTESCPANGFHHLATSVRLTFPAGKTLPVSTLAIEGENPETPLPNLIELCYIAS
jgi:hypothetical protein